MMKIEDLSVKTKYIVHQIISSIGQFDILNFILEKIELKYPNNK